MREHADLIDELGGVTKVAEELGISHPSVVGNWRTRGVAWTYRSKVADLAKKKKVALPAGFLDPKQEKMKRHETV